MRKFVPSLRNIIGPSPGITHQIQNFFSWTESRDRQLSFLVNESLDLLIHLLAKISVSYPMILKSFRTWCATKLWSYSFSKQRMVFKVGSSLINLRGLVRLRYAHKFFSCCITMGGMGIQLFPSSLQTYPSQDHERRNVVTIVTCKSAGFTSSDEFFFDSVDSKRSKFRETTELLRLSSSLNNHNLLSP